MDGDREVAKFVRNTTFEDLPSAVVKQAKRCLLDQLGAVLAGTMTRVGKIISAFGQEMGGNKEATVLGTAVKVPYLWAIMANAFLANALDIDDGHRLIKGHPGAFVFPAVINIAEKENLSGKRFLTAMYVIDINTGKKIVKMVKDFGVANSTKAGFIE